MGRVIPYYLWNITNVPNHQLTIINHYYPILEAFPKRFDFFSFTVMYQDSSAGLWGSPCSKHPQFCLVYDDHRIHGAGIYTNIKGVY